MSNNNNLILSGYGEIGLKGKNRGEFINYLIGNIQQALKKFEVNISHKAGRIIIKNENNTEEILNILKKIPGLVKFFPVITAPLDIDKISEKAVFIMGSAVKKHSKTTEKKLSFKVETKRANKEFELTSPEINKKIGAVVLNKFHENLTVDVHNPDITLYIEVRFQKTYLYSQIFGGTGGLPVKSSGKGILLLSGGIDSPAAGWMGMKRGLKIDGVHFHSFPYTSERSKQKVIDIAKVLAEYSNYFKLHIVHFTKIQESLKKNCSDRLTIILMRRMMIRLAQKIAARENALSLLTGESLGQVSSQTLESIQVTNSVAEITVFRPLIGLDKTEIVDIAKKIGTYKISIQPYEDCCTLFVSQHPATKPSAKEISDAEKKLDIKGLINDALSKTEVLTLTSRHISS